MIATDINSPDGKDEKEIIIRSDGVKKSICIIDCRGEILCIIDENVGANYGVPAVADLDNDEYKEIIAGTNNKMFVWSNEGILKNGKALFKDINNRDISSTPVVCDFNNDGKKEILVATKGDSLSYIYAIKHDGTLMPGFDGSLSSARIAYPTKASAAICHSISVGDINNDGNLEVVALGCDNVRAWKNDGSLLLDYNIDGLFPNNAYAENITPPLLADVNGDSLPEILFNMQNSIYAIDFEGNCVSGFPIITDAEINNTISVSDVDADGKMKF